MDKKTANEVVTGAPGVITLGGKSFFVAQPDDKDHMILRKYLRDEYRKTAKSALASIAGDLAFLKPEDRAAAIKAAVSEQHAGNVELDGGTLTDMLYTPVHCAFWVGLLIKKASPDIDVLSEVNPYINGETVVNVLADLLRASSMADIDPNSIGQTGS